MSSTWIGKFDHLVFDAMLFQGGQSSTIWAVSDVPSTCLARELINPDSSNACGSDLENFDRFMNNFTDSYLWHTNQQRTGPAALSSWSHPRIPLRRSDFDKCYLLTRFENSMKIHLLFSCSLVWHILSSHSPRQTIRTPFFSTILLQITIGLRLD